MPPVTPRTMPAEEIVAFPKTVLQTPPGIVAKQLSDAPIQISQGAYIQPRCGMLSTVILMMLDTAQAVSPARLVSKHFTESPLLNEEVVKAMLSVPATILLTCHL